MRDAPGAHHVGAVGEAEDAGVLLDQEEGRALLAQADQHLEQLQHEVGRQAEGQFVDHDHPRAGHQRPADREHLLLPSRQRPRGFVEPAGQGREQVEHPVPVGLDGLGAVLADDRADLQVLPDAQGLEHATPLRQVP